MGDVTIGGLPLLSRRFGNTEIAKIMAGEEQIWPPIQLSKAISSMVYVGATGAFGTHQAGDLLVVMAVGPGATPPTAPAGFLTAYTSPATDFSMAVRLGYRFASGSGTTNGTWSTASWITTFVFRGADSMTPFGAIASIATPSNTKGNAPAITPVNTKGQSTVVAGFVNNGSSGGFTVGAQPAGWFTKNRNARIATNEKIDTRFVNQTTETLVGGGSVNWRGLTYEVLPADGMQYIGGVTVSGASVGLPAHLPGDLLLVIAQVQGTTAAFSPATPPDTGGTVPTWHVALDQAPPVQGVPMAIKIGWAIATANNHTSGTWSNATFCSAIVIRGANQTAPIGAIAGELFSNVTAKTITSPTLSLNNKSGKSMIFSYFCNSSTAAGNSFSADPPAGWVNRVRVTKTAINGKLDRTSGVGCTEDHLTTGLTWRTASIEIVP